MRESVCVCVQLVPQKRKQKYNLGPTDGVFFLTVVVVDVDAAIAGIVVV